MRDLPAQRIDRRRYTPVSVDAVLRDPSSGPHWKLIGGWLFALILSIALGGGLHHAGWHGLPVSVGGTTGVLDLNAPLLFFGMVSLWLGFSWGYLGALLSGTVVLVIQGVPFTWAVLVAGVQSMGLLTLTLAYRAVPIRVVPREPFAVLSFMLVALLSSLTTSIGQLFYGVARQQSLADALPGLTGGWIGPFIQWIFIVGPLMTLIGPRVIAFKEKHGLGEPWRLPERAVFASALSLVAATLTLAVVGNRAAARLRLESLLDEAARQGWHASADWTTQVHAVVDGPQATSFFSLLLIVSVALLGYQVATSWSVSTKESEEALRESEARSRALIEAVPDLVLRIRADGTVVDHKDGLGLLGSGDLKGQSITDFWPSRITHPLLGRAEDALNKGSSVVEFRMETDQGLRDFEARLVAFDRKEVIALVRDVTEQRTAVRDTQGVMVRLTRELRAPLTSVRGALGLIRGGVAGEIGAKVTQLVDVAYRNAERMVRLADDILAAENPDGPTGRRLKLEQVDLARLVEASVYEVRKDADELGVEVEVGSTLDEARVKVDPDRVVEVVHILLENALKFSPASSRVQVSVRRSRDIFRVEVRDEGHGIPEAFQPRVFRRGSQEGKVGLALAREIVLTLGGRIGFESKLGRGTTFWFELPEQVEQRQLKPSASAVSVSSAPPPMI
ncbi:MAG: HAMP domain-containing histidine kinase [Alphaproteobacteria bacterium]|nr:HAMP domain-containing histidine kinase [Alphaproteobacteria bacterium]